MVVSGECGANALLREVRRLASKLGTDFPEGASAFLLGEERGVRDAAFTRVFGLGNESLGLARCDCDEILSEAFRLGLQAGEAHLLRGESLFGMGEGGASLRFRLDHVGAAAAQKLTHRWDHEADDDDEINGEVDRWEQKVAQCRRMVMSVVVMTFGVGRVVTMRIRMPGVTVGGIMCW